MRCLRCRRGCLWTCWQADDTITDVWVNVLPIHLGHALLQAEVGVNRLIIITPIHIIIISDCAVGDVGGDAVGVVAGQQVGDAVGMAVGDDVGLAPGQQIHDDTQHPRTTTPR